jgi:putative flavoprotein involved in K+ transport
VREDAIVVGAGFAGLGSAAMLKRRGLHPVVFERSNGVGESWRNRYDSLRLNTLRWMSTLSGYRIPRSYGRWPSRDQLVKYLEDYAREMDLRVEFGVTAERVERSADEWTLQTSAGEVSAPVLVIAAGYDHEPKLPDVPGTQTFTGELIHAAAYREPSPYRGKDVLMVSAGNTGSEIAFELVENGAARVRCAVRTPPNPWKREWPFTTPTHINARLLDHAPLKLIDTLARQTQRLMFGDLTEHGLPPSPVGIATNVQVRKVAPLMDDGFIDAVKEGRIEIVSAVDSFDGADVVLADGSRLQPDAVIAATGYSRGLEPMVGHLDVLDNEGIPRYIGAPGNPETPGLYFNGYRTMMSSQLGPMRIDARRIAREVARRRSAATTG